MSTIIKIIEHEFLLTKDSDKIKYCEINSKYKTKLKIEYASKINDLNYLMEAIGEELTERIYIREIENK